MKSHLLSVLILPLFFSCSSEKLTSEAGRIRVVKSKKSLSDCKPLGKAEAHSTRVGSPEYLLLAPDDTAVRMYNKAAEMGGDTILVSTKNFGLFGSQYEAYVFKCNSEASRQSVAMPDPQKNSNPVMSKSSSTDVTTSHETNPKKQ